MDDIVGLMATIVAIIVLIPIVSVVVVAGIAVAALQVGIAIATCGYIVGIPHSIWFRISSGRWPEY